MKKSTDELLKLLSHEKELNHFLINNQEEFEHTSLQEELNRLLKRHEKKKSAVILQSNLDRTYAYQIFDGSRPNPSRNKLLALCIAAGANLSETQRILRLGHAAQLHPRNMRDSVIIYALEHQITVMDLNITLHDLKEEILS